MAMVRYARAVELPELGASRRVVMLRRPGLRVYVIRSERLVVESRVFDATSSPVKWPVGPPVVGHLIVPLDGTYVARRVDREHALRAPEALVDPGYLVDERWEGPRFSALCVEWSADYGTPIAACGHLLLSTADQARLAGVARAIVEDRFAAAALPRLIEVLRACGLPLRHPAEMDLGAAPRDAVLLARAFSAMHTALDRSPAIGDVEALVGLSERHIRRQLTALGSWWVTPEAEWRASLRRARLVYVPCLATVRGATVERIARAVGYRSASALLHALDADGVPAPSAARELARAG